jgi:hypothetical protein
MRAAVAASVLLVLAVGCYSPPKAPPALRVTTASVAPISKLCLLPLAGDVEGPERLVAFQKLLSDALVARHYETVDVETTREALERLAREAGGYYDPHSGEPLADHVQRVKQVRARAGKELGCQALVEPRVAFVIAPWQQAKVEWDGASRGMGSGLGAYGTIGALSLHLRIADLDDRELFFGAGGIEPTARLNESLLSSQFEALPEEQMLDNEQWNRSAIEYALQGWPSRPKPAAR